MRPLNPLARALFGGSVFTPRQHIHVYNQLVWWSFFGCTLLFLRAFFGLGTFDDLALVESSLDTSGLKANNGDTPGTFSHAAGASLESMLLRERMGTQDLVDSSAAQFVADVTVNLTAVAEDGGDTSSQHYRASNGESALSISQLSPPNGDEVGLDESVSKLASWSPDVSGDEDAFTTHFTSGDVDYTIDITTPQSRHDLGIRSSQPERFLSFEEFDENGVNFALKIWLQSSYPLAVSVTLGEDEICEGSRGIKCLPED